MDDYSHWSQDPRFWDALDTLTLHSGSALKELLDVLYEYKDGLDIMTLGLLFGGVGEFFKTYSQNRRNTNSNMQSFSEAVKASQNHPLMLQYMQMATNAVIDGKVQEMKE
jgi:hypothetical protein